MNIKSFSDLNIKTESTAFKGKKIEINKVLDMEIIVQRYEINPSKYPEKGNGLCLWLQILFGDVQYVIFSGSGVLMGTLRKTTKDDFPFRTKIVRENQSFEFR